MAEIMDNVKTNFYIALANHYQKKSNRLNEKVKKLMHHGKPYMKMQDKFMKASYKEFNALEQYACLTKAFEKDGKVVLEGPYGKMEVSYSKEES